MLAFDPDAGSLRTLHTISSLPPGCSGEPWAADLHLTPDGRFLYSSERRSSTPDGRHLIAAGQRSHRLSACAIDAQTGALDKRSDCTAGQNPNWIEVVGWKL